MSSPESARKRRHAMAQAQGRSLREYKKSGLPVGLDAAAWRREYKRLQRRKAGARLRADIAAETQAKREKIVAKAAIKLQKDSQHDAHVRRYIGVLKNREDFAKRYKANPQAIRDRIARHKQMLPDSYVIQNLKSAGIPLEVITPSLIELKREAMQYGRLARHIKSTVKNHLKEQNETITEHS